MIKLSLKCKYNKGTNTVIITAEIRQTKQVISFIERFGYEFHQVEFDNRTEFYIKVKDKDDYKRFKSLWSSAKQFI